VDDARNAGAVTRFRNVLYPLHAGHFGGSLLPIRLLWALLGLMPAVLFASGVMMTVRRVRERKQGEKRPEEPRRSREPAVR
jgi:uncharacterized iron-regulated membrane protein